MFNDINLEEDGNWDYSTFDVENFWNEDTPIISKSILIQILYKQKPIGAKAK